MQKGDMLFFLVLTTEAEFKESYLKSYYYGKPFPAVEVHRVLRDPADFNAARAEVFDRHKKLSAIIKQRGLEDRVEWIEKKNRDTGKVANDSLPTPEQTKP
jgi:hypothetical protein